MIQRRVFCASALGAGISLGLPHSAALAANEQRTRNPLYVAQLYDTSMAQQDVSRDFMIGARSAWQEQQHGSVKLAPPARHKAIEVDGSEAQLQTVLNELIADPACLALAGTVGQSTARWVAEALDRQPEGSVPLVQIAPWLHDPRASQHSIRIFATQETQISHALKTLALVGLKEVGVVFSNAREQRQYDQALKRLSQQHKLQIKPYLANQGFYQLGVQLPQEAPAVLLFMAGTPELAQFSKGAGKSNRHRYAIGMADINSQTLQQMGLGRNVPVVITQVVPLVTAALPLVRDYRQALSRFFDEPPSPLSLSGYVSAQLTQKLLANNNVRSRAQVAALAKSQWQIDLGGHVLEYDGSQPSKAYVTQSMVASDGRLIG